MKMHILFPLILTILFSLIHMLAYTRIVKHLHIKPSSREWLKHLLIANMIAVLAYVASRYLFSPPKFIYFFLSLSIGVGFILLMAIILYELLHFLQRLAPFKEEKRVFFKRSTDLGFLMLGSTYIGAGILEGGKEPLINRVDIRQNRFDGAQYRIVQISDMHIGGLIDRDFVSKSVEAINALDADLIAITGDLTDAHIDTLKDAIDEFRALKSRYGTYYVVGNHEYFHSAGETIAYLKSIGFHVLENASMKIDRFYIAGVYDLFGYRSNTFVPDITEAIKDIPPNVPTLLLAHQPKYIEYLEGFAPSLILSGHTHGGQVWPFGYLVSLVQPYLKGLYSLGENRHIYVNSGIGFWGPPMRLGSHAEITCITWS